MAIPEYKKRARAIGEKMKEKSTITLVEGPNCLRIGPTPEGETSPAVVWEFQVHQNIGPKKVYLRCGHDKEDDDHECWLCDEKIKELKKKKKFSRVEALIPESRLVVQASVVKEDDEGQVKFNTFRPWYPSAKIGASLLTSILGHKKRDYVDRKRGFNITIERTGTGFKGTTYGSIEPDDEPTVVPKALINAIKPFDQVRGVPKYSEKAQKAAYEGKDFDWSKEGEAASDESDSSDETESGVEDVFESESDSKETKKGKSKMAVRSSKDSKSSKKSKKEEEDDDEEEESEEQSSEESSEEDSDDKKKKKSKDKKKKKSKEKDSDEEDDSDEKDSDEDDSDEKDSDEKDSDEEEEADSDEEEDSDEKPKKKDKKKAAPKKTASKKKTKKK